MAAQLQGCGWVRDVPGGLWSCPGAPAWVVGSGDHDPNLSILTQGDEDLVVETADRIRSAVDAGKAGPFTRGKLDRDRTFWHTGGVNVSLHAGIGRRLAQRWLPAVLQLHLERTDTPPEGRPPRPDRDRDVARHGSAVARWHLAGEGDLTDDVVELLALYQDPTVVAALKANEPQRRAQPLR